MPIDITFGEQHVGNYGIIKSTYDIHRMDRLSWNEVAAGKTPPNTMDMAGVPDAWRMFERTDGRPEWIELTENLQHWILRCNLEAVTGKSYTKEQYSEWWNDTDTVEKAYMVAWFVNEMNSVMRANRYSVNKWGYDNCANFLTGARLDGQLPKGIKIVSGWACVILQMESDGVTPMKRTLSGVGECYAFQCINASLDVWQFSPLTHRHLFDIGPMVTAREVAFNSGGHYIVRDDLHYPFGQFKDLLVLPIILPMDEIAWRPADTITFSDTYKKKVWIRS